MSAYTRIAKSIPIERLLPLMSAYPPFLGAGIRVKVLPGKPFGVESSMRLGPTNANFVGTHFGGSLYAMCDPFFMFILLQELGDGFVVWDKAAEIRFVRPGKGRVSATFRIPEARVAEIREAALRDGKTLPVFTAEVRDGKGELVAEVVKTLYVRDKSRAKKP